MNKVGKATDPKCRIILHTGMKTTSEEVVINYRVDFKPDFAMKCEVYTTGKAS